jgi:maleate isomerase
VDQETDDATPRRIGLIVPSSNVTMESEIPIMLRQGPGHYAFHSSRMRMQKVSATELRAMDTQGERCVQELVDAKVDILAYACLVAIMVQGPGSHRRVEERLSAAAKAEGSYAPVISSAGALVDCLHALDARRIAIVAPYLPALTAQVIAYFEAEGLHTTSVETLGIDDNHLVGCIPGSVIQSAVRRLDLTTADALVLSACVQMPSLAIVEEVQESVRVPVLTAATATAASILSSLGQSGAHLPGAAGALAGTSS